MPKRIDFYYCRILNTIYWVENNTVWYVMNDGTIEESSSTVERFDYHTNLGTFYDFLETVED